MVCYRKGRGDGSVFLAGGLDAARQAANPDVADGALPFETRQIRLILAVDLDAVSRAHFFEPGLVRAWTGTVQLDLAQGLQVVVQHQGRLESEDVTPVAAGVGVKGVVEKLHLRAV